MTTISSLQPAPAGKPQEVDMANASHSDFPSMPASPDLLDFFEKASAMGLAPDSNTEPLPTPPNSQKLPIEHDPDEDIDQGSPLVASQPNESFSPLLEPPAPVSNRSLPGPFSQPINFNRFGMLVDDLVNNKYGLRQYLKSNISVTVKEPAFKVTPERVVPLASLWKAAHSFAALEIPDEGPRFGHQVADTVPSNLHTIWYKAMRLAYVENLYDIPSGLPETLSMIGQAYEDLFPPKRSALSRSRKQEMQTLTTAKRMRTPRIPSSYTFPETPAVRRSVSATPKTASQKRKRSITVDTGSPEPKQNQGKRQKIDVNAKALNRGDRFCRFIKAMLNERSKDVTAFKVFEDAEELCPKDPNVTFQDELDLAVQMKVSPEAYRTVKYRTFLGVAMLTEQNLRMSKVIRNFVPASPNDKRPSLTALNITSVQLMNNVDVNKVSTMFKQFDKWGWMSTAGMYGDTKNVVSAEYLVRYPKDVRTRLFDKVVEWEDHNIKSEETKAAIRESV